MNPQTSYVTDAELPAIEAVLHKRTPYVLHNVGTRFAISRRTGFAVYGGEDYVHAPEFDELVRGDVFSFVATRRRRAADALERMSEDARKLGLDLEP